MLSVHFTISHGGFFPSHAAKGPKMRAFILDSFGQSGVVQADIPVPQIKPGEVLVEIHASGVNPADIKIAEGHLAPAAPALPAILGMDFAGVITEIGEGVTQFSVGDAVYGCGGGVKGRPGTLAEYAAIDARLIAHKPANLSMREAAALPLVSITAWEGLVDRAEVAQGDKVLIQAGAGGVGHMAVQIAKAYGAEVFATASTASKQEVARELGATPIPYRDVSVKDYVAQYTGGKGFDIVYDTVGGSVFEESAGATRRYGKLISCAAWEAHNLGSVLGASLELIGIFMLLPMLTGENLERHGEILKEIACLVEAGKMRPQLDPLKFTLDNVTAAHAHLASGQAVGKVVVDIRC